MAQPPNGTPDGTPDQPPADSHEPTAILPTAPGAPAGAADRGADGEATRLTTPPAATASVTGASVSGVEASGGRAAPAPIGPGTLLSHTYEVDGLIARGGMGEVHRARHVDMNTWHAVKVIRPELAQDAKMVELLRREAAALREIRHEAVVSYDGVFRDEYGRILLSMEYLDGPSLQEVLQGGPLGPDDVAILLDRIASGLAAAHQRGIVHRDMSADNVILPGREIANAKIIDFGIAKQTAGGAGTVIGDAFAGKYGYASPEQFGLFGGEVGPQSDIYSAGLVLAAAALGRPLDMGRTPQAMIERRMSVPDLSALDEPLRGVLCSMLEPDPQNRAGSMTQLVGALTRRPAEITPFDAAPFPAATPAKEEAKPAVAEAAKAGGQAKTAQTAAEPKKKAPVGLIAGGVGGLAAAGIAGFLLFGQSQPPAPAPAPTTAPAPVKEASVPAASATQASAPPATLPAMTTAPLGAPASPTAAAPVKAETPGPVPVEPAVVQAPAAPVPPLPAAPAVQAVTPSAPAPIATPAPAPAQIVPAAVPAAPPVPPITPAEARRRVEAAAAGLTCAGVRAVETGKGLRIGGHVGSDADAGTLKAAITGLPGGVDIAARVAVRPWPLCEALGVAGLPARAEAQAADALELGFNRPSMVYRQGEKLEITVTPGMSGYLTVDYIDIEGNAIHMVPMRLRRDDRVDAGRPVTLGIARSPSDRVYTIAPPYGPAMILALVTSEPLFPADREEVEPAGAYLASLRAAIAKAEAQGSVVVQSAFFTTMAE
ncbi:serine/threonine-protein kinase [Azospirillum ramasamyi]|uniref:Serine/threonine kinase n=1 Tax=Azospirillum ramasamyi TaxID=682998 RepID=A0A2U9SB73_9PROT|nr:serine/threonine-protein kinase [Azospirillum ramasamyi]AWU96241.1 serine/threonine kinase [Azospirillum ramasamyi]